MANDLAIAGDRVWVTGAFDDTLTFARAPAPLPTEGNGIESGFVIAVDAPR